MEFYKKLRSLSASRRYSQDALAREVGVSQSTMSSWIRGRTVPGLYEAAKLAELLGVDVNYLADDEQDEPSRQGLTEEERAVLKVLRALRLDEEEALRRLYGASVPSRPATPTSGSIRDETALELRIQQQLRAEAKPERRGKRSVEDSDKKEGAKPDGPHKRIR